MNDRFPHILNQHKIAIICEGSEEYAYLDCLKNLGVWSNKYKIELISAGGNGNIPARYQDRYQNASDELVLIFCDTEKKPYEQYEDIKIKINDFHGIDTAADLVVIFSNPCTMQIIMKHFTEECIKTPAKKVNAPLIEKHTGVCNYKARNDQLSTIMSFVDLKNYDLMKLRIDNVSRDDKEIGSTNFRQYIEYLENDDCTWIKEINDVLES